MWRGSDCYTERPWSPVPGIRVVTEGSRSEGVMGSSSHRPSSSDRPEFQGRRLCGRSRAGVLGSSLLCSPPPAPPGLPRLPSEERFSAIFISMPLGLARWNIWFPDTSVCACGEHICRVGGRDGENRRKEIPFHAVCRRTSEGAQDQHHRARPRRQSSGRNTLF